MGLIEIKSPDFVAAARRLTNIGETVSDSLREGTRVIEPEWKRLVSGNASTTIERRIIAQGARLVANDNGVRLESTGGRLSGGLNAAEHGGAVEFGVRRGKRSTYRRRSKNGKSHRVTRVTTNQLRPFNKKGYVFTPAVKAIVPKLAKAWTEALKDDVEDALNGKG